MSLLQVRGVSCPTQGDIIRYIVESCSALAWLAGFLAFICEGKALTAFIWLNVGTNTMEMAAVARTEASASRRGKGAWQGAGKPHSVASHGPSKLGQSQWSFVLWLGDNCAARQTQPHIQHRQIHTQTQSDSLAHTHTHADCVMWNTSNHLLHAQAAVLLPFIFFHFHFHFSCELCFFFICCSHVYLRGAQCVCVFLIASQGIVHTPRVTNQQDMLAGNRILLLSGTFVACHCLRTILPLTLYPSLSRSLSLTLADKHFASLRISLSVWPRFHAHLSWLAINW